MHPSVETAEQTERRLQRVIAAAECVFLPGEYGFEEFPLAQFPAHLADRALAFVRDDHVWSVLRPAIDENVGRLVVFRFHFVAGLDNSGFVGWLATRLKHRLGTGVVVVCGQNSARGGVFDYWGAPVQLRDAIAREIALLRPVPP